MCTSTNHCSVDPFFFLSCCVNLCPYIHKCTLLYKAIAKRLWGSTQLVPQLEPSVQGNAKGVFQLKKIEESHTHTLTTHFWKYNFILFVATARKKWDSLDYASKLRKQLQLAGRWASGKFSALSLPLTSLCRDDDDDDTGTCHQSQSLPHFAAFSLPISSFACLWRRSRYLGLQQ